MYKVRYEKRSTKKMYREKILMITYIKKEDYWKYICWKRGLNEYMYRDNTEIYIERYSTTDVYFKKKELLRT